MKVKSVLLFLVLFVHMLYAQTSKNSFTNLPEIDLWGKNIPDGSGPENGIKISATGSVTNVSVPKLLVGIPENPNGVGILIISGGGYAHIEIGKESHPAALWLQSLGITTFELEYRLPQENWKTTLVPFQDAQRAMRIIRSKAVEYHLNPDKIGILGFSAGGHLAGYTSSAFETPLYPLQDTIDMISARPDFCGLIYPVISMLPPNNKTHSFKSILGKNPSAESEIKFSVEHLVTNKTPVTFIAQAKDDPVSPIDNSLLMFNALKSHAVPVEIHIFQTGGHGWGLGKPGTDTQEWPKLFEAWLKNNHIF